MAELLRMLASLETYKGKKYNIGLFNTLDEAKLALDIFQKNIVGGVFMGDMSTYKKKISASGNKYIYAHKPHGWTVAVSFRGGRKYIGLFDTIGEALNARNAYLEKIK